MEGEWSGNGARCQLKFAVHGYSLRLTVSTKDFATKNWRHGVCFPYTVRFNFTALFNEAFIAWGSLEAKCVLRFTSSENSQYGQQELRCSKSIERQKQAGFRAQNRWFPYRFTTIQIVKRTGLYLWKDQKCVLAVVYLTFLYINKTRNVIFLARFSLLCFRFYTICDNFNLII